MDFVAKLDNKRIYISVVFNSYPSNLYTLYRVNLYVDVVKC